MHVKKDFVLDKTHKCKEEIQKMAKWPKHFISGKQFKKGQIWQILLLKRPNGNPGIFAA